MPKIPEDRAHEYVVLFSEVIFRERAGEKERSRPGFLEELREHCLADLEFSVCRHELLLLKGNATDRWYSTTHIHPGKVPGKVLNHNVRRPTLVQVRKLPN